MSTRHLVVKFSAALALFLIFVTAAIAAPWKFGVMSDTQWKSSPDGKNPNGVAVGPITHINQEFIKHGVKFVIQTGDLTQDGNALEMDTTATFRQALYNAGIGFYPLRGNHEASAAMADEFRRVFPQTLSGVNNQTPMDALVTTTYYGAPLVNTNSTFTVGQNFTSPTAIDPNLAGLSYAFDFDNARIVILDTFAVPNIPCNLIENQQPWITSVLSDRPANTHAFVFSHKGLMTENHADNLFTAPGQCDGSSSGGNPAVKLDQQNIFMASLHDNKVEYLFNGHDHMHNSNIVTSPDGASMVHNITMASNSYKYYIPQIPESDFVYNNQNGTGPVVGNRYPRETEISQELFTQGYYIFTVDGPRVTVDFYSSPNGCNGDCDQTSDVCPYTFTKKETFGYSLNGKEFLVAQGESYKSVQDSFHGTNARILDGTNNSTVTVFDGRKTTKSVDTGWTPREHNHYGQGKGHGKACGNNKDEIASNILTLWGMTDIDAKSADTYTLSMSYDPAKARPEHLGKGRFGLATTDDEGNWVNVVEKNVGGSTKFVKGPWKPGYGLGTYGIDPATKTAWAVINYTGDFAVASFRKQ